MKLRNLSVFCALAISSIAAGADELVILHTNDTHSQLDPADNGRGGVLRRKVLIDSVREKNKHVLLIDCGDAVQGTLYYTLFKGEVERKMMNALGYDIAILGNHEFDNGMEPLAQQYAQLDADKLSTNYDVTGTPLEGLLKPYTIKEIGDRKIGFLAINLDPKGMIADSHVNGIKYLDGIKAANSMAWYLKNIKHADMVIALTHVGYDTENPPTPSDIDLAAASTDIDIIIGGHSHTTIDPAKAKTSRYLRTNAEGDTILVVQTGSRGASLGEIKVDLKTLTPAYRLINVDKRLDNRIDPETAAILSPYRQSIDSLKSVKVGRLAQEFPAGSQLLLNWVADVMLEMGKELNDGHVDLSIVNKGGIRRGLPAGHITKEHIMTMLPFDNRLVVLELSGKDLLESIEIMRGRGGDGISAPFDITSIEPDKTYTIVTIDYLANGGDYMEPLTHGKVLKRSKLRLDETMIEYLENARGHKIKYTDDKTRM